MADDKLVAPVTDAAFQKEVLKASKPTLVDFWAAWCAPCRAIAPVVEELAGTYKDKIQFRKLDIDSNPAVPTQYGIRGIPTLILFKDGKILDQVVGAVPKENIERLIKKAI
ncbi:MAG: thioredoxin [Pseudomonadota bacterium]